ncbi:MAG: HD domain-containing phosphohydrolase [Planctomycetota bacterium]
MLPRSHVMELLKTQVSDQNPSVDLRWSDPDFAKTNKIVRGGEVRVSEVLSALSVALDITQGLPQGHSMRSAIIGMRIAEEINLAQSDRSALFYALLLKDLGCSSNAAKISFLFQTDDHTSKRSMRLIDWTRPSECVVNSWCDCAPKTSTWGRLKKVWRDIATGTAVGKQLSEIRCNRGANIARQLGFPEATAQAIQDLDEHWNGRGAPMGKRKHEISLLGRICCLAQTTEVFFDSEGVDAALDVAAKRSGKWFDPELVRALESFRTDADCWAQLDSECLIDKLRDWEPQDQVLMADEDYLDRIAESFASVVDAKSPWTFDHSSRVAEIAVGVAEQLGCQGDVIHDIRRAGLLHDIGKLGVSNLILDKPGKPTDEEYAQIRLHSDYSFRILSQVEALNDLAFIAAGHHERLDGKGYHLGLSGSQIPFVTRILSVADVFEALSAKRPYRDGMPREKIEAIMNGDRHKAFDGDCLEALWRSLDRNDVGSRVEAQLTAVENLVCDLGKV